MARPTKAKAIERLRKVLNEVPELKKLPSHSLNPLPPIDPETAPVVPPELMPSHSLNPLPPIDPPSTELLSDSPEFKRWHRNAQVALRYTFGDNSSHLKEFNYISFTPKRRRGTVSSLSPDFQIDYTSPPKPINAYMKGLDSAEALLKSMIEEIEEDWENDNKTQIPSSAQANDRPSSNKVFVIHGRDDGVKQTVARFLETLDLEPVILHEQANLGRTIIEKFEDHAHVGFAVALLTPDDVGSLKAEEHNSKPRARQNVIFEFGYFIGKLGRKRVCALVKGNVERPSDYDGVLYIPLDDTDGWKMRLIKELKSAGFEVDANRAL